MSNRDVIIKSGIIIKIMDPEGIEKYESFDNILPIDRVITLDGNNNAYLYDMCIPINNDMIEKEL